MSRPPFRREAAAAVASQKLHKILAQAGLGSRRMMEDWIREGRVTVNGAVASIGDRVTASDVVKVGDRTLRMPDAAGEVARVLLYHKPEGEIVSRDDPQGRETVFRNLPPVRGGKWLAVGRLDYNTSGLLIFTTSGELANRLTHPKFAVDREYAVRVLGTVTDEAFARLRQGISLPDGMARCEWIEPEGGEGANRWYRLVVNEGRNRVVRRLFEALGLTVSRLMRVRFGPVLLPTSLRRGQTIEFTPEEVARLEAWLDENPSVSAAPKPERADHRERPGRTERPQRVQRPQETGSPTRSERPQRSERPRRGERPERAARSQAAERQERGERPQRAAGPQRGERPQRAERTPGTVWKKRGDRPQRTERPKRGDRPQAAEWPKRGERPQRTGRSQRGERPEKAERPPGTAWQKRGERPQRTERPKRGERPQRAERPQGTDWQKRGERPQRTERPRRGERPPSSERAERPRGTERPKRSERPQQQPRAPRGSAEKRSRPRRPSRPR